MERVFITGVGAVSPLGLTAPATWQAALAGTSGIRALTRFDASAFQTRFGGEVKEDSSFVDDLGADSLDIVELVMAFEEAFDLDIPDEDAEKIQTVKDAVDYIESKKKS